MWGWIIAIISGALMSVQGVFNTEISRQTSLWISAAWAQLTGFLVCAAAWAATGQQPVGKLLQIDHKYMLLAGVIGALITITVVKSVGNLGPARATMFILTGQLAVSWLIGLLGMFGVEKQPFVWRKLIALLIISGGIIFFQWE